MNDAWLRRALTLLLAASAAGHAACGGNVILDQNGSAGTGAAGTGGSTVGTGGAVGVGGSAPGCVLLEMMPFDIVGPDCQEDFPLAGPASVCAPGPGGTLPPAQCAALCPPSQQGLTAQSCMVEDILPAPDTGAVTCIYEICGAGG